MPLPVKCGQTEGHIARGMYGNFLFANNIRNFFTFDVSGVTSPLLETFPPTMSLSIVAGCNVQGFVPVAGYLRRDPRLSGDFGVYS